MKALSLWQPWASAIALGAKRLNRTELIEFGACWNWCGALGRRMGDDKQLWEMLPFGAIIAVADLVDCRPTGNFTLAEIETPRRPVGEASDLYDWTERQLGNFELGRFGWVLDNVRPLAAPVPYRGEQGLFDVPDELVR